MDSEPDYTKYGESELVEIFKRLDPRYAPPERVARVKRMLVERGYIVTDRAWGPASVVPSPEKLQSLVGSTESFRCAVKFDQTRGLLSRLEPAHNDFGLVGIGTVETDGIDLRISGRRGPNAWVGLFAILFRQQFELALRGIEDVEADGNAVHFTYRSPEHADRTITLWLSEASLAQRLYSILPAQRSEAFRPQLKIQSEFERDLVAQSPQSPVTLGLMAINALVFLLMAAAGAGWVIPDGVVDAAWGSNFGPYTTDGQWWRLLSSIFIHLGIVHLLFNMWALASFGPLTERLYGSVNYLLIYLVAGITSSLSSIAWQPDVNSAGASGAIFGILGALLAAQLASRNIFPSSILRPLRNTTLLFIVLSLLGGFAGKGIDNAAHLGGFASGFLLGLSVVRPVTGKQDTTRGDFMRVSRILCLAIVFSAGGVFLAKRASASSGESNYWLVVKWVADGEQITNGKYSSAAKVFNKSRDRLAFADEIERDVVPFWREALSRTSGVHLRPDSARKSDLEYINAISDGNATFYELYAEALQSNDSKVMVAAHAQEARLDELVKARRLKVASNEPD